MCQKSSSCLAWLLAPSHCLVSVSRQALWRVGLGYCCCSLVDALTRRGIVEQASTHRDVPGMPSFTILHRLLRFFCPCQSFGFSELAACCCWCCCLSSLLRTGAISGVAFPEICYFLSPGLQIHLRGIWGRLLCAVAPPSLALDTRLQTS